MNIDSQWFTCDKSKSKLCRRGQSQSGSSMLTRPHIVMVFICFYWIIGLLFKKVSCEAFGRWTLQSDFATWWSFSTVQLCRKTKGECNIPVLVLRQHGSKWFAWIERLSQTWKLLFTLTKVPWPVSSSGCSGSSDVAFDSVIFYRSRLMIFRVILPWFQYRRPLNFFINGGGQRPSACCVRWW